MRSQITAAILILALAPPIFADLEIKREEAANLPSVDIQKLNYRGLEYEGKIVRLKFNYRSSVVEKLKEGGGLSGTLSIWQSNAYVTRPQKSGNVKVTVPPEGVAWFMKIPTTYDSRSTLVVIARITKASGEAYPQAELLGREIKTDLKGSKVLW
jgi:hypothetical protein